MDVIPFGGRDDNIMLEAPLLIVTSNNVESPISRLPTELLMLIFQQCESDIRPRLTLTHTCRRWRQIAVNDASLWTKVYIITGFRSEKASLDNFLSFLGMQLDRAANKLLDVCWYAVVTDKFFAGTLQLIRKKAPFSRWKTLKLHIFGGSHAGVPWSSVDTFTNLESLRVLYGTDNAIISAIDRRITSRLKILDLGTWPTNKLETLMTTLANSFTHISTFCFNSIPPTVYAPFLHENVVDLRLKNGKNHPFPHIQTYELDTCIFGQLSHVDVGNLTTLIVNTLTINDRRLCLQALRELKLGFLEISLTAEIEAPGLDTLHFMKSNSPGVKTQGPLSRLYWTLQKSGYLLSPNNSLIIDSPLSSLTLTTLLTKSPKVTNAILVFDDWAIAQEVLGQLLGYEMEINSPLAKKTLCPRLSELRLNFDWEFSSPLASKEWLLSALKSREKIQSIVKAKPTFQLRPSPI